MSAGHSSLGRYSCDEQAPLDDGAVIKALPPKASMTSGI